MITDSVCFLRRATASVSSTTPSTSSTPGATTPATRSSACAPRSRPAPRTSRLCDTNGSSLPPQVARGDRRRGRGARGRVEVGIHTHNDAECGVANSLAAVDAGARLVQGTMNGYGERTRQRQPRLDPARAAAQAGLRVRPGRPAAAADRDLALRRRALQPDARPGPAVRRPQRLRPQGRHARGRRAGRRPHVRARRARAGRQQPRRPDLGARPARARC